MRLSPYRCVSLGLWLVTSVMLMFAPPVLAQGTSTINGRLLDQGDTVLPGATVTTTNTSTGVVRSAVTNGEGDRKSTRLNSSHIQKSRMPSSA